MLPDRTPESRGHRIRDDLLLLIINFEEYCFLSIVNHRVRNIEAPRRGSCVEIGRAIGQRIGNVAGARGGERYLTAEYVRWCGRL